MPLQPGAPVPPPAPGDDVLATWGDAVADHVVQRFPDEATRDAMWTGPPAGAVCVTEAPLQLWIQDPSIPGWTEWPPPPAPIVYPTNMGYVQPIYPKRDLDASNRAGGTRYTHTVQGAPAGTIGVFANVTIASGTGPGVVTVWGGTTTTRPNVSTVNFVANDANANTTLIVVPPNRRIYYQGNANNFRYRIVIDLKGWVIKP